jgi:hypothetical protein
MLSYSRSSEPIELGNVLFNTSFLRFTRVNVSKKDFVPAVRVYRSPIMQSLVVMGWRIVGFQVDSGKRKGGVREQDPRR